MIRFILVLWVFLLQCTFSIAGSFRHLSVREGLSSRQVYQVEADSAGFIWAYTNGGINRYDGSEIRYYSLNDTLDSKSHIHSATTMVHDRHGNIWVAMKNGKIYAYDRKTDSFQLRMDLSSAVASPVVNGLLFDDHNRLWLCLSSGLYGWSAASGLFLAALKGQNVCCVCQLEKGLFYAGTDKRAYQLQWKGSGSFSEKQVALPMETHIISVYATPDKVFMGTFANSVLVMDRLTGQTHSLHKMVPHVPVRVLAPMDSSTLLIGTDGAGIFRIDRKSEILREHYAMEENDENSLDANTVSDICIDRYHGIWVSTSTNGISYLDQNLSDVQRIRHIRNYSNSLNSDHVNVIFQDAEGDCWYGTNHGVSLCRSGSQEWTHFLNGAAHGSKVVLAIAEDSRGTVYVGGYGMGVYRIHKKTGKVERMDKREGRSDRGIATDYVYTIDVEGEDIWFGGIEGELTRYHTQTDAYTYYPIDCIGDIKPGRRNGTLWMAGCDGLALWDRTANEIRWRRKFGDITLRYPVRCLLQSASGEVWMATDGDGLVCFRPDEGSSYAYTMNDGLASNAVNSLLEDKEGRIWFTTEKELYCLDPSTKSLVCANDFLGISWGYYNPNAALELDNGDLAFGTAEGVVAFSPEFHFKEQDTLRLILTDFKLLYESVKAGGRGALLETNIDDTPCLHLKHDQNSFSLSFSSFHFASFRQVRYAYRLENYNADWAYSDEVGSVNYMNLSPGRYTFRLRALDKYTGKQWDERSLEIVVDKPFWLSGWALLSYLLAGVGLVYLFVQYWRRKRNEDKIKEKIHSFISIAHDIRTPITLIKAPLGELENQKDLSEENKERVTLAGRNADKLLGMITQLLDLQKAELCMEHLKLSPCNMEAYLEKKQLEFRMVAVQKGIEIRVEVEEDMPEVWMDKEKMEHIVDNLLSNALKYTEQGVVHIRAGVLKNKWMLEIEDTGIGIPAEEQKHLFHEYYRAKNAANFEHIGSGIGLMVVRRLVKQHHGDISFSSVEGQGTTFTLVFPQKIKTGVPAGEEGKEVPYAAAEAGTGQADGGEADKNVLLLVEDNADMREYLTNSLCSEYQVIGVADGGKALEKAREISPDLIISDVIMPVMGGDELCRVLKSSVDTSHIPVILLTALSAKENIIMGLEAGANDYITKPFDLSVLKARIRNIIQNRQRLRDTVLQMDAPAEETDYTSQLDKEFLDKMLKAVEEELANSEFSINDFCRMLGMSRTAAYNKIKALTGQGPNDFIRIVRLNKSKELLLSRRYNIGEVSAMVGFSDPKYFSTCFKKQFGVSPSKI